MSGETRTLADRLIEQGVFTQESWNSVKKDFEHTKGIIQTSDAVSTSALPPCQFQTVDGVQYAIDYAPDSVVNYVLQIEATPERATLVDLPGVTWKKEQSMRAIQAWLDENWS